MPCNCEIIGTLVYALTALASAVGMANATPTSAGGLGKRPAPAIVITGDNTDTSYPPIKVLKLPDAMAVHISNLSPSLAAGLPSINTVALPDMIDAV
jgi:hypothetical protein